MSVCAKCGAVADLGDNFCAKCGNLLPHSGDTTTSIPVIQDELITELSDEQLKDVAALRPNTALLIVTRGANSGAQYLIDEDSVQVGRHPKSDIFFDDVTVSRRHAEFRRHSGNIWLTDLGSLNGTYVNRTLIDDEVALRQGDEVQIGKFRLVFYPGHN